MNLKEKMILLQNKKEELDRIQSEITVKRNEFENEIIAKRNEFEKGIGFLKSRFEETSSELDELLSGETVFIKLGDLIEELSVIGQIASQDIDTSININPPYRGSMRHIESLDARHVGRQWVELRNKKYSFCYQMYFSLDLYEVQADDRLLLDHCTYYGSDYYPLSCHELRIDKNIEALAYPFQLNRIVLATSNDMWRPADLMAKAVISCVEKKKYMTPEEMKQKQELFYDLASKGQTVKIKK